MDLSSEAARLIVERVEGNLLAAKQELEKLALLAGGAAIDADLVLRSVGDSARYDVFQLGAAAAAGDAKRALRVLLGLKSEGVRADPHSVGAGPRAAGLVAGARTQPPALRGRRRRLEPGGARPRPRLCARVGTMPLAALLRQAAPGGPHRQGPGARRCLDRGHRLDRRDGGRFAS